MHRKWVMIKWSYSLELPRYPLSSCLSVVVLPFVVLFHGSFAISRCEYQYTPPPLFPKLDDAYVCFFTGL